MIEPGRGAVGQSGDDRRHQHKDKAMREPKQIRLLRGEIMCLESELAYQRALLQQKYAQLAEAVAAHLQAEREVAA